MEDMHPEDLPGKMPNAARQLQLMKEEMKKWVKV
jgi:hypothetical protein